MDEIKREAEARSVQAGEPIDLEALIAVVEARIVENLTQMIERMAQQNADEGGS